MDLILVSKNPKAVTPVKDQEKSKSKVHENNRSSENVNPNVSHKSASSPLTKSAKSQKSVSRSPNPNPVVYSPRKKIRERKFVVAKKHSKKENAGAAAPSVDCKCKFAGGNAKKCLCVAYENLRASQEDFFKKKNESIEENNESGDLRAFVRAESEVGEEVTNECGSDIGLKDSESPEQTDSLTSKRRRDIVLEEARKSVPERGKVSHLVKAFERMLTIPKSNESDANEDEKNESEKENDEKKKIATRWALPGLQPPKVAVTEETQESSCSSCCPSELILTAQNLGLDPRASVSSSWDSNHGSITSRTSNGGRRSRRNSSESLQTVGGRRWKKQQVKVTSQKPFQLRTEQRGKQKEEEFMKKLQEMIQEEEKQRIPIAQGLPWTTDEPESLIKPEVKESTRPLDLKLHSDVRAVERAEFDHQVSEKLTLIELYKMERERQQKLAEEEETKRLRKELIPKAQPMPYFDRPFVPRRLKRLC